MSSDDILMGNADADNAGELLVWPWTGVLAMTTADGDATSTLAFHAQQHFAGIATTALQEEPASHHHHQDFLLLHFGKSWAGLRDAMSLARHFAGAGRREWQRRGEGDSTGGGVFGWAAEEEDLLGDNAVGRFLRESGVAARSVEDVQKDETIVAARLGAVASEYERRARFLEAKCEEMVWMMHMVEEENSCLHGELKVSEGWKTIADNIIPQMNNDIHEENEKLRVELDAIGREIESRVERIQELKDGRTKLHCSEVQKLVFEINSWEIAGREAKASDHAQMLHEKHKEEMETIYAKVIQLEKEVERSEAQVSAIRLLNMKLQAGENLTKEECQHLYKLMIILNNCLDQEHERLKNSFVDLTKRDRLNRDVLQESRQELIKGLESMMIGGNTVIGIKRMGQLDEKPFHHACKRKYRDDDPEGKAARLVSSWQDELKKTSWHPFKTIQVDGEDKDVVDEDDPKLRQLWTEYGDNVCNAVKVALRELNEYSPHGRHTVNELWDFREARKATMAKVVKHIFEQLNTSS